MMFRLGILVFVGCVAAGCQERPAGQAAHVDSSRVPVASVPENEPVSSADTLFASLEEKLAPLDAAFESMADLLRPDSATGSADSLFLLVQARLDARARSVAQTFDNPAFQILIYPQGPRGQQLRRRLKQDPMTVLPEDSALADSIHRFLNAHGIWSDRTENKTWFVLGLARLSAVAAPFVTSGTKEYLRIEMLEQLAPAGGDPIVAIPWDSLGDRLAGTDYFLSRFPEAPTRAAVRDRRTLYLRAYLTGGDSTKMFGPGRAGQLRPEPRASYERYVALHGTTASAAVVRRYLRLLAASQYRRSQAVTRFLARL